LFANALPFLITLFDPILRPGVSQEFAINLYLGIILPNGVLAALVVPLFVYAAERAGIHTDGRFLVESAPPRPQPSWVPFALALAVTAIAIGALTYAGSSDVRVVAAQSAAAAPAAAPGPADTSAFARTAELIVGASPDTSCASETSARSEATDRMTEVTLLNNSGQELQLSWLDFQGKRVDQGPVPVGERGEGRWGVGHVFLLSRPDGTCLVIFKIVGASPVTLRLVP